jgi:hypothetical protein
MDTPSSKNNIPKDSKFRHLEDSLYNPETDEIRTKSGHLQPIPVYLKRDWSSIDSAEDADSQEQAQNLLLNQDVIIKKRASFFKKFFETVSEFKSGS